MRRRDGRAGEMLTLTFSSKVWGDARLGPPPVGPGALILPAGREERSGGKRLRRDGQRREGQEDRTLIHQETGRTKTEGAQKVFKVTVSAKLRPAETLGTNMQTERRN